jgi:hypothetical protein
LSENQPAPPQNPYRHGCLIPVAVFCLVFGLLLLYENGKCRDRAEIVRDYASIGIGMSREEVVGLLGKYPLSELQKSTDKNFSAEEFQVAEVQAALFAPDLIYVFYTGGKVVGKHFIPTDPATTKFFPSELPPREKPATGE